jgi:hypothetical protein
MPGNRRSFLALRLLSPDWGRGGDAQPLLCSCADSRTGDCPLAVRAPSRSFFPYEGEEHELKPLSPAGKKNMKSVVLVQQIVG